MKTAEEHVGGPYLEYGHKLKDKAIGMPPEETPSPEFSRPEPPSQGGYTTSPVSLPRYQFEVSEQPTLGTSKALPSSKTSTASLIEKIAEAVDAMDQQQYYSPPVLPAPVSDNSSAAPAVGALLGAPLGWYAGNEYGMSRLPGYHALDQAFNALTARRGTLEGMPLVQNAADVVGGTLWGKKELLKMFGPIGAYRIGGAAAGLGGGLLAGALINKAMEPNKQASLSQLVAEAPTPAWHDLAELGGLGILAVPSVASLAGNPLDEQNKEIAEVAGLGLLATPSVHALLRRV